MTWLQRYRVRHYLRNSLWVFPVGAMAAAIVLTARTNWPGGENVLAERLDLFEDLAVLQNREALEDLEVVSVLHQLEARP